MAAVAWADADVGIEIYIEGPPRSVGVRAYTHLLDQVLLSLEELDRFALPGRVGRIEWTVSDLSVRNGLQAVIAPRKIPNRRPLGTLSAPAIGFINGIRDLQQNAEIPPLFSPIIVERVQQIGRPIGENGVERVEIRPATQSTGSGVVDTNTVEHARRAVNTTRKTWGSLQGRLDTLSSRTRSGVRAQILIEETRHVVVIRAASDQANILREAWGQRVLVGGELQRNLAGQAVRLDMTELSILPERDSTSAWTILGISPGWTGDLSTEEYMRQVRNG